jgi:hypothetical protein
MNTIGLNVPIVRITAELLNCGQFICDRPGDFRPREFLSGDYKIEFFYE